jgi:hypothetical protein
MAPSHLTTINANHGNFSGNNDLTSTEMGVDSKEDHLLEGG